MNLLSEIQRRDQALFSFMGLSMLLTEMEKYANKKREISV